MRPNIVALALYIARSALRPSGLSFVSAGEAIRGPPEAYAVAGFDRLEVTHGDGRKCV